MKCQEALARLVAKTKGDESEAAKALREFESRRAQGEDVIVFPLRGRWLVGSAQQLAQVARDASAAAKDQALATAKMRRNDWPQ